MARRPKTLRRDATITGIALQGEAMGERSTRRRRILPIYPAAVLRLSAGRENIPPRRERGRGRGTKGCVSRKRAASVSRRVRYKRIKDQEINASISSNTAGHSSALWRRVCAAALSHFLFIIRKAPLRRCLHPAKPTGSIEYR